MGVKNLKLKASAPLKKKWMSNDVSYVPTNDPHHDLSILRMSRI